MFLIRTQVSSHVHYWPEYKEVPHGSAYGYGTARGMAKLYGILANGGKLGDRVLLSSATLPKLNEVVSTGMDRVLGVNITRGYGTMEEMAATAGIGRVWSVGKLHKYRVVKLRTWLYYVYSNCFFDVTRRK